jgi:hypothetical protein
MSHPGGRRLEGRGGVLMTSSVRSSVRWIALVLGVALTTGTAYAGVGQAVPELGSGAALTALALMGGASLIWTNRRK